MYLNIQVVKDCAHIKKIILVIDKSVAEGAYLALRVRDLPISLGNVRVFNIDFLKI